ncbi:MAG: response regulator, partial [Thermoanaerobaculia bacterium]
MQTILLVEDNEMNRDLISRRLKRRGFEVVLAVDGAEGVEKATELKPDLVLMDMGLPVMDGYEATRLLKANDATRGIPVVGLSAHAMSGDAGRAMKAGCDDYDTKPIEWPRLLEKISQQLMRAQEQTTLLTPKPAVAEAAAAAGGAHVLIVDDNAVHREMLAGRLAALGHTSEVAHDGARALELAAEKDFDAVLLDVTLPAVAGKPLLDRLRTDSVDRDVPVLMLSTIDSVRSAIDCLPKGADDFIPQPFHAEVVAARLTSALDRRRLRLHSDEIATDLAAERRRSAHLLDVLLPAELVAELRATGKILPRRVDGVALLDCEVADFARSSAAEDPLAALSRWQQLVVSFEDIAARHGLTKVRTTGATFLAAAGLFQADAEAAIAGVRCALEMQQSAAGLADGWDLRLGLHEGAVIAGVVGHQRYQFDVWGAAVDDVSRVSAHGAAGGVHVSDTVWQRHGQKLSGESVGQTESAAGGKLAVYSVDGLIS